MYQHVGDCVQQRGEPRGAVAGQRGGDVALDPIY